MLIIYDALFALDQRNLSLIVSKWNAWIGQFRLFLPVAPVTFPFSFQFVLLIVLFYHLFFASFLSVICPSARSLISVLWVPFICCNPIPSHDSCSQLHYPCPPSLPPLFHCAVIFANSSLFGRKILAGLWWRMATNIDVVQHYSSINIHPLFVRWSPITLMKITLTLPVVSFFVLWHRNSSQGSKIASNLSTKQKHK